MQNTPPRQPSKTAIEKAARIINSGGTCVFPTWCLYGIGADALNPDAVKRVYTIKKRDPAQPLLMLIKSADTLDQYVADIPPAARRLMDRFWPGKLTLIFHASAAIPLATTGGTGKIGIRLPEHPVARHLTRLCNNPITGTSANLSGNPGCSNPDLLDPEILSATDMVLSCGTLKGGTGSTIVDITGKTVTLVRQGEITANDIHNCCD